MRRRLVALVLTPALRTVLSPRLAIGAAVAMKVRFVLENPRA